MPKTLKKTLAPPANDERCTTFGGRLVRPRSLIARFWEYQKERFPLLTHGILIASFSSCGLAISASTRDWRSAPQAAGFLTAFIVSFLLFLQLRIADEHKDEIDDAEFRPYRPVPRGLISLAELSRIGIWASLIQVIAVLTFCPLLLLPLSAVWIYMTVMTKEFFVGEWLKRHPIFYAASHMCIIPLIDLFTTACDWLPVSGLQNYVLQPGLVTFLVVSFCNGIVIEVGRKIRYKDQEEVGVETYSSLWGPAKAAAIWFAALCLTACFAIITANTTGLCLAESGVIILLLLGGGVLSILFQNATNTQANANVNTRIDSKLFEVYSAVWTVSMYLSLGGLPFVQHLISSLSSLRS